MSALKVGLRLLRLMCVIVALPGWLYIATVSIALISIVFIWFWIWDQADSRILSNYVVDIVTWPARMWRMVW